MVSEGSTVSCGHTPPLRCCHQHKQGVMTPWAYLKSSLIYSFLSEVQGASETCKEEVRHGSTDHSSRGEKRDCL